MINLGGKGDQNIVTYYNIMVNSWQEFDQCYEKYSENPNQLESFKREEKDESMFQDGFSVTSLLLQFEKWLQKSGEGNQGEELYCVIPYLQNRRDVKILSLWPLWQKD